MAERKKLNRSYTITNEDDYNNIMNGRCPNYALFWDSNYNKQFWDIGHNYIIGNNVKKETPKSLGYKTEQINK